MKNDIEIDFLIEFYFRVNYDAFKFTPTSAKTSVINYKHNYYQFIND
jgi:hypothetical protein